MSHPGECEIDEFCGLCIKDDQKALADEVARLKVEAAAMRAALNQIGEASLVASTLPFLARKISEAVEKVPGILTKPEDCECGGLSLDQSGKTHKSWCNDRKRE